MTPSPHPRDEVASARRSLVVSAQVALVGAALGGVNLMTGWGFACPFRALTGQRCPLCGSTHLAVALLQGRVGAAWDANPFVFAVLLVWGFCLVLWGFAASGRPIVALAGEGSRFTQRRVYAVLAVAALAFGVARDLAA